MPKISVVIPVYNTSKYLAECLDSVLSQTLSDIEIICVNDGSTDNSAEVLKQYEKKDSRIKVITQKNLGVVIARNNGIQQATADLIYPLDSDDIIAQNCLEKLHHKITNSKYRVVMSNAQTFGKKDALFTQPRLNRLQMYGWHENCIISALFYKSDFIKFGGYCVDFNGYGGDDMDYWLNYMDNNIPMVRLPDVLFFYRIKDDVESVWRNYNPDERVARYKHKEAMLAKRHPKIVFWVKLRKFLHCKVIRFLFRIQNNRIKIFKIPVWKTRKYDTVDIIQG